MFFSSLILAAAAAGDDCPNQQNAQLVAAHVDPTKNIVETAVAAGSFNTLAAALAAGELVDALQGEGPFTVFAPTDAAFAALPEGTLESLLEEENKGLLQAILTYHVVPGAVAAKQVVELDFAGTLNGQRVDIVSSREGVSVDGARVTMTDILCSNGIIHVIDAVILPSTDDLVATAVGAEAFPTLVAAVQAAGLVEALQGEGPFTVFAPTEEAFAALPEGTLESLLLPENIETLQAILKLHVVPGRIYADAAAAGAEVASLQGGHLRTESREGEGVFVNGARVLQADIEASNGVIHVIDTVLLPQ
jgi:uncharacterized surface protein with fasciclin (FAS1) repeats